MKCFQSTRCWNFTRHARAAFEGRLRRNKSAPTTPAQAVMARTAVYMATGEVIPAQAGIPKEGKKTKNVRSLIKEDVNHHVKDIKTIYRNLESERLDARLRGHDGS